ELGGIVPDSIAAAAGIDVERYAKEKLRRERMAQMSSMLDAELAIVPEGVHDVIATAGDMKLLRLAHGHAKIVDADGAALTDKPISEQMASALLEELAKAQGVVVNTMTAKSPEPTEPKAV